MHPDTKRPSERQTREGNRQIVNSNVQVQSSQAQSSRDSIMPETAGNVKRTAPVRRAKSPTTTEVLQTATPIIETASLNERHYDELVNRSGIRPDIAKANFATVQAYDVAKSLGFNPSDGGEGFAVLSKGKPFQYKPDNPQRDRKGDAVKYLTKKGFNEIIELQDPSNPNLWAEVERNTTKPLVLTEGAKKAAALLSIGIPAIAFLGVHNWRAGKEDKHSLNGALLPYLKEGREVIIAFDADAGTNRAVSAARKKLARAVMTGRGIDVKVATWKEHDGKGIDDYLVNKGEEAVRILINESIPVAEYLRMTSEPPTAKDLPQQSEIAKEFAETVKEVIRYRADIEMWMFYEGGRWQYQPNDMHIKKNIQSFLETHLAVLGYYSAAYFRGVLDLVKTYLAVSSVERPRKGLINFSNGVYDHETKVLSPHAPGYFFTYILPYDYDPNASIPLDIEDAFLQWADGRWDVMQVLFAWINAVLLGKTEFQRFLSLTGVPKSGKSTYADLVSQIAGKSNVAAMSLKHIDGAFEMQRAVGKSLLMFNETSNYIESLKALASMVGEDEVRVELKNRNSFGTDMGNYKLEGVVMLVSNTQVKSIDDEGINRRRLPIHFGNKVSKPDIHFKPRLFAAIPGIVNKALSMTDEEVEGFIVHTLDNAPSLVDTAIEKILESSNIGEWVRDHIIAEEEAFVAMGRIGDVNTLLGSYTQWAEDNGIKALASNYLSNEISKLFDSLELEFVEKARTNKLGRGFKGLRLRTTSDDMPLLDAQVIRLRNINGLNALVSEPETPTQSNVSESFYDGFRFAVGTEIQGTHTDGKSVVTGKVVERLASLKEGRKYYRLDSGTSYYPHDVWEDEAAIPERKLNIYEQQEIKTGGKRTL